MTKLVDHRGRPRVVVTGGGLLTPCGVSMDETWAHVVEGRSGIGKITLFDPSGFDTQIAGEVRNFDPARWMDGKEIRRNDRFIQFAVAAADMALTDASFAVQPENAERVAVVVGAGLGGLESLERNHRTLLERGPGKVHPFFIPSMIVNLAPGQISIRIGARGPNWSPVSACSTSAHALGEAAELIRRGGADVVVAGGTEATVTPLGVAGFNAMKALSRRNDEPEKASRPWDEGRDGFVMGEGAGIVVLENLEHALGRGARIRGELSGYGATADAYHITAPSGVGARRAMELAILDAGLRPDSIGYINAHGTSTPIGDLQEIEAMKLALGAPAASRVAVSSTKSMHGHLLGASGAVEAVITLRALETGILPPTINLERPSEGCDLNLVPGVAQARKVDFAMSNSFGFGGTNVSLVFARWQA